MFNFIKKFIVRFLTRKAFVVANKATLETFIISHITDDAYVTLLTSHGSYLPISYSVYKSVFEVIPAIDGDIIVEVQEDRIELSSGESVFLADINESCIEDSLDSDYL